MCGIAGAIGFDAGASGAPSDLRLAVQAMLRVMKHRGPDDEGIWHDPNAPLILGHLRLAIVDLSSAGHQPMHWGSDLTLSFNGEIYNFREVRAELTALGVAFRSNSDTEVILAAVAQWGVTTAVTKFVGMFAFAVWDARRRELSLVRDRYGEKPLFVCIRNGILYFASELRAFRDTHISAGQIDRNSVRGYLMSGYVPTPLSLLDDVVRLPAATILTTTLAAKLPSNARDLLSPSQSSRGIRLQRYWDDPGASELPNYEHPGVDECKARLDDLLTSAVRNQLQCDVPVGVFLSSGVDSSVVAALAQRVSTRKVSTFTVRFDTPGFDESHAASDIAKHLGTDHSIIELPVARILDEVPKLACTFDEPTGNASYFPLALMAREASRHVKVVLTGDAGDELFAGYNRYRSTLPLWSKLNRMPRILRRTLAASVNSPLGNASLGLVLRSGGSGASGQLEAFTTAKKFGRMLRAGNIGEAYLGLLTCWESDDPVVPTGEYRYPNVEMNERTFLRHATCYDRQNYMEGDNLAKADRATMLASIEARVPLLDHRVAEYAASLPDSYLLNGQRSKFILRQLAASYVPTSLLERPKMGFTVPMGAWLRGPLKDWAMSMLDTNKLESVGLSRSVLSAASDRFYSARKVTPWQFWTITMLSAWAK